MSFLRRRIIKTDGEYHVYLREIVFLMDLPNPSEWASKRLLMLAKKVAAYETQRFKFKETCAAEKAAFFRKENK